MKKRVLILCTGNSARSQMAEGLWDLLAGDDWDASSAGTEPTGEVHPMAIEAMHEIGIDISEARSKSVDEFAGQSFDLAVTVCDAAQQSCPTFPGATETLHWPFDDPAAIEGGEEELRSAFRRVRDEIAAAIHTHLAESAP